MLWIDPSYPYLNRHCFPAVVAMLPNVRIIIICFISSTLVQAGGQIVGLSRLGMFVCTRNRSAQRGRGDGWTLVSGICKIFHKRLTEKGSQPILGVNNCIVNLRGRVRNENSNSRSVVKTHAHHLVHDSAKFRGRRYSPDKRRSYKVSNVTLCLPRKLLFSGFFFFNTPYGCLTCGIF